MAFHDPSDAWRPVPGVGGLDEVIVARDEDTGDSSRLVRFAPGTDTGPLGALSHEFWEEAWIVSGSVEEAGRDGLLSAGMYACRPPGTPHGPFVSRDGCLMLEIRYHTPAEAR